MFDPVVSLQEIKPTITPAVKLARLKELLYTFGRCSVFCDDLSEKSSLPPWDVFHANSLCDVTASVSNVAYNPIIMATPTDYSTVYTVLLRLKECMNALGQQYAPVIFDMSLLAKALEIVWSNQDELHGVIPCEGGMHLLMSVFAGIGYLYGDAGLRNLLTESGVYAPTTVNNILAGKDFDRAMTAFKMIDEALNTRFLINFETWCIENDKYLDEDVHTVLRNTNDVDNMTDADKDIWNTVASEKIIPLLEEFREESRQISPTFKLWDEYLTRVSEPLKLFISSTRKPEWTVHQYSKLCLLPLLFASNRTTYAKYMTVQVLNMNRLPQEVEDGFLRGLYTAKLSSGKFNNVWLDYALEATENKALKGTGGVIGLTLKDGALARWFLSRPLASRYSTMFHSNMCKTVEKDDTHHADTHAKREHYDRNVNKMVTMFDSNFLDPFDTNKAPERLVNFATCLQSTEEIEQSMLNCIDKGEEMLQTFVAERLKSKTDGSDPPVKSFFSPMPRSSVKTMSENKKNVLKKRTKTINSEVMFQRLFAVNSYKKIPPERVFAFENTPVPSSIFNEDGTMLKCKKSDFMTMLEDLLPNKITQIHKADTMIFDGMAIVQSLQPHSEHLTFKNMAENFMNHSLKLARHVTNVKNIHIVFDRYRNNSLKTQTRNRRGDRAASSAIHIHGDLAIPKDWKSFLSIGKNKERLISFYTQYMVHHSALTENERLFISGGAEEKCLLVTGASCRDVEDLQSNHEEADTRIILHASYAQKTGSDCIVISSPDTDVLLLLLHHHKAIGANEVYMSTGRSGIHTDSKRLIPIHSLYNTLSQEQHNVMLTLYCLTGCDTTSSFYGKGKRKAFKLLMQHSSKYQSLQDMGEEASLSSTQYSACVVFLADLYSSNGCTTLNAIRCTKALNSVAPKNLPPTDNSFHLHCLRCVLQLWIWKHAMTKEHQLPPPSKFGYKEHSEDGTLQPVMMTQPMAAPELLNDMVCHCAVCSENCSCFKNKQPCTVACACEGSTTNECTEAICTNVHTLTSVIEDDMYQL